jgi:hypothetical protein
MEAVCNFFLCAVYQYRRNKKSALANAAPMTSIINDLVKGTIALLEYINQKLVKLIDNEAFVRKFKILSNWLEAFINRWLWLSNLSEIRKSKELINEHKQQMSISSMPHINGNTNHNTSNTSNNNSTNKTSHHHNNNTSLSTSQKSQASPNEIPPPSPASSVGSSYGSSSNGTISNNQQNQQVSSSQSNSETAQASTSSSSSHLTQLANSQRLLAAYERYFKYNEFSTRSQSFWDSSEHQINEIKYLTDFRDTIKQQTERELHIDSEIEIFAAYVLTGLQLFRLSNY